MRCADSDDGVLIHVATMYKQVWYLDGEEEALEGRLFNLLFVQHEWRSQVGILQCYVPAKHSFTGVYAGPRLVSLLLRHK